MEPRVLGLWEKLQQLELDEPSSSYSFSARLAKENGWRPAFAQRVVEEYRRFLLLAAVADHPVSPPEAIDQAWHLHLLYTRSYWDDLCGRILKRPLHHEPTRGGSAETAKFGDWYEKTLASYQRIFGEPPPSDIWPTPQALAKQHANYRRVNVARYVLLPRLRWPSFVRRWTFAPAAALAIFGLPLLAARDLNVFNWTGPDFLAFYVPIVIATVLFAVIARFVMLRDPFHSSDAKELSPDEAAYLAAGSQGAIGAALGALISSGAIEYRKHPAGSASGATLHLAQSDDAPRPPLQREILRIVKADPGISVVALKQALEPATDPVRSSLEERGLIYSESAVTMARIAAVTPLAVVLILGAIKLAIGLAREKPVLLLVLSIVPVAIALWFVARQAFRTSLGDGMLDRLRKRHAELATTVEDAKPRPAHDMGYAYGLFGLGLMGGMAATSLGQVFPTPRRRPDGTWNDSSSSSGGSSCGSSCSSGDSGGSSCGGGGGCGGCGGGGD